VVRDTSGRGLHGYMVGVTYDPSQKAFVSTAQDGSQWIETKIPQNGSRLSDGFSGTIWVNHRIFDTTTKNSFVWTVGDRSGTGNNREFGLTYNEVGQTLKSYFATFNGGSGNLNLHHTSQTSFNTWTHVGITYDGTTVKLYINGAFSVSSTLTDVNISDNNCVVRLNGDAVSANSTHQGTPMSLSNFKLYDVALTATEVKQLYDMGRLGNVIAQPVHISAPLYAPGVPVQFVSEQVHDRVAFSTAESTHISPLDISITPHFSNSKIYLIWRIEYEVHHDANFRIYRDSTLIGYNTVSGNVQWSGVTASSYDQDTNSTPAQSIITWIDEPNTTSSVTYKVYMKRSGTANWSFFLNRSAGSSGANAKENGVSQKTAMEIAQ